MNRVQENKNKVSEVKRKTGIEIRLQKVIHYKGKLDETKGPIQKKTDYTNKYL